MTATFGTCTEETRQVGEIALHLLKGGAGVPTLVLHGIEGDEGWNAFHQELSGSATVYAPSHPGFGRTECPDWFHSVPHLATFYNWYLQEADLRGVDLIGVGLGGWIAAQMAIMSSERLRSLTLVGAAGILPEQGEVYDVFVELWRDVIQRSFRDHLTAPEYLRIYGADFEPQFGGIREAGRTMAMKLAYRPFMYDRALPGLLGKIRVPTLVVWGDSDRIIPMECGERYARAIPGAQLAVLEECGHWAHLDRPEALAGTIRNFVELQA